MGKEIRNPRFPLGLTADALLERVMPAGLGEKCRWCGRSGDLADAETHDGQCPAPFLRETLVRLAALEAENEQLRSELADERGEVDAGGRPMTKMEHAWMDCQKENERLREAVHYLPADRAKAIIRDAEQGYHLSMAHTAMLSRYASVLSELADLKEAEDG